MGKGKETGQLVAKKEPFFKVIKKHWMLLLMLAPAVCYVIVFSYIPMTGVILAFKQYQYKVEFITPHGLAGKTSSH